LRTQSIFAFSWLTYVLQAPGTRLGIERFAQNDNNNFVHPYKIAKNSSFSPIGYFIRVDFMIKLL
jgi:hypothetical protein